jgi:hypothetical protein
MPSPSYEAAVTNAPPTHFALAIDVHGPTEGAKRFVGFSTIDDAIAWYAKSADRSCYEIIRPTLPTCVCIDVDCKADDAQHQLVCETLQLSRDDPSAFLADVLKRVVAAFPTLAAAPPLVSSSHGAQKLSFHVKFAHAALLTHDHRRAFAALLRSKIGELRRVVDMSIYSRNRPMRLLYSHKLGDDRVLVPVGEEGSVRFDEGAVKRHMWTFVPDGAQPFDFSPFGGMERHLVVQRSAPSGSNEAVRGGGSSDPAPEWQRRALERVGRTLFQKAGLVVFQKTGSVEDTFRWTGSECRARSQCTCPFVGCNATHSNEFFIRFTPRGDVILGYMGDAHKPLSVMTLALPVGVLRVVQDEWLADNPTTALVRDAQATCFREPKVARRVWFPWYAPEGLCWSRVPDALWRLGTGSLPGPKPAHDADIMQERYNFSVAAFLGEYGPRERSAHSWRFLSDDPCPKCGEVHENKQYCVSTLSGVPGMPPTSLFAPCNPKVALLLCGGYAAQPRTNVKRARDTDLTALWSCDKDRDLLKRVKEAQTLAAAVRVCIDSNLVAAHWVDDTLDWLGSVSEKAGKRTITGLQYMVDGGLFMSVRYRDDADLKDVKLKLGPRLDANTWNKT